MIDIYKRKEEGPFPTLCDNFYVLFDHVYRKTKERTIELCLNCFLLELFQKAEVACGC